MNCLTTDQNGPETEPLNLPRINESTRLQQAFAPNEHERPLMAYDLHDGLAQDIAGVLRQFPCFREAHKSEREDGGQAFDAGTRLSVELPLQVA